MHHMSSLVTFRSSRRDPLSLETDNKSITLRSTLSEIRVRIFIKSIYQVTTLKHFILKVKDRQCVWYCYKDIQLICHLTLSFQAQLSRETIDIAFKFQGTNTQTQTFCPMVGYAANGSTLLLSLTASCPTQQLLL